MLYAVLSIYTSKCMIDILWSLISSECANCTPYNPCISHCQYTHTAQYLAPHPPFLPPTYPHI